MKLKTYWLLLLAVLFQACLKDVGEPIPTSSIPVLKLDTVWTTKLFPKYSGESSLTPIIIGNSIVFHATYSESKLFSLDKNTGVKNWEINCQTQLPLDNFYNWDGTIGLSYSKKLIVLSSNRIYAINPASGSIQPLASLPYHYYSRTMSIIGDYAYISDNNDDVKRILKTSINYPSPIDTVFKCAEVDFKPIAVSRPALWVSASNDSLLVFQTSRFNPIPIDGYVDLYAYNLKTKQIQWHINHTNLEGNSAFNGIFINNNSCFLLCSNTLFSFDMQTGSPLWNYSISNDKPDNTFIDAHALFFEDKLLIKTKGNKMLCFYRSNGNIAWVSNSKETSNGPMYFYNGNIYFIEANALSKYEAMTGKLIASYSSPNQSKTGSSAIQNSLSLTIDYTNGLMYFFDGHYATCVKIPK
jgi:outer membrane protein assembly factor BamB